jgi:protein gp37
MGKETGIAWTDHTFNPWWGCTKVSPGCDNCYAETFDKRLGGGHWGKGVPRREFSDKHWAEPLKWNADAAKAGRLAKVFCASMADVMDDEAPIGARERLWALVDATPNLFWQLLTKRPHRYVRYLPEDFKHLNVGLGFTAENQQFYNVRMNAAIPGAKTLFPPTDGHQLYHRPVWVSYEPALGPLTLRGQRWLPDWVIFGGETGHNRRPMEQSWAENLLAECRELGISFFMKQMSAATPDAAKEIIPAHLRVLQFPKSMERKEEPATTAPARAE